MIKSNPNIADKDNVNVEVTFEQLYQMVANGMYNWSMSTKEDYLNIDLLKAIIDRDEEFIKYAFENGNAFFLIENDPSGVFDYYFDTITIVDENDGVDGYYYDEIVLYID